ncbi:LCP family protein [Neobacillus sp. PS2-9]|uniref:LCP family protein n=1 Tax=Neobacillus sp. PS2-9 TaxID=3070676 RepID=UPI0027E04850|nr:LCP family protein [Neobacillus sp. PS2-9]WML57109.1 LCP family protein [Neobacillus sp. PS2-9]
MKIKIIISLICLLILPSCSFQHGVDTKQKEKNIAVLLSKMEEASKKKTKKPFNGQKDANGKINVLIIGIDSRGEKKSRSDAIMVAQYDPHIKMGKIVTIMRDSYVEIPSENRHYNKINNAYYLGGPELLRQTIKNNFDIDVKHFITIDFIGFIKVIDMVAPKGIEVNVDQKIIEDMRLNIKPGVQRLHGKELLSYVRFRHDKLSDFGRVQRQQEVLASLKNEFTEQLSSVNGVMKLPTIGEEMIHYIDTDMDFKTFVSLCGNVLFNQVKDVETIRIPVPTGYSNMQYPHSGQVLQIDFAKNKEAMKEFLGDKPTPVTKEKRQK